jgi:hypothetical protein
MSRTKVLPKQVKLPLLIDQKGKELEWISRLNSTARIPLRILIQFSAYVHTSCCHGYQLLAEKVSNNAMKYSAEVDSKGFNFVGAHNKRNHMP